ncbi:putative O-antigen transporter [Aeromonas caviae]|uniref:O-antigen transporter n=1 Tax=Aeromonas caviae TaxID=648 RepID=A0AAI9KUJ0_AERCA|nr:flippase [Aeromonas caviae]BDA12993.1 putative O-antigen transporter [Aeromonas caviae]GJA56077.1 putative O-antigen transporter [Aeromonas caviae]
MDKTLFKNIASLFGIQGMSYLIPLITLPYLVRVLDPVGYGSLGFSLAIVQYCCMLTDYGFNLSATQQIAVHRDEKHKVSKLFWSVLCCKVGMAMLSVLAVSIAVYFVPKLNDLSLIIYSGLLMVLGNVLFPTWLFQGKEKMGWIAISNITARLLAIPLIFIFVNKPEHAYIAALISSLTIILASCIGLYFVWRQKWVVWYQPTLADLSEVLRDGWHVFISSAAISLYTTSTTVILGFISGPMAVGYFVAADKLRQAVLGLITPFFQALYPRVNATMAKSRLEGFLLIRKILKWQSIFTFALSLVMFITAPLMISLAYGEQYDAAVPVLLLMAWLPFVIGLSNVFGMQTLLVLGYKETFSKILMMAGLIHVVLNLPLTYYNAEVGAAISVLLTEIIVTTMMLVVIAKKEIPLFKGNLNAV